MAFRDNGQGQPDSADPFDYLRDARAEVVGRVRALRRDVPLDQVEDAVQTAFAEILNSGTLIDDSPSSLEAWFNRALWRIADARRITIREVPPPSEPAGTASSLDPADHVMIREVFDLIADTPFTRRTRASLWARLLRLPMREVAIRMKTPEPMLHNKAMRALERVRSRFATRDRPKDAAPAPETPPGLPDGNP